MLLEDKERILTYIENVKKVLEQLQYVRTDEEIKKIVDLSELYVKDALYYLNKKDYFTSLACISYAEGLLDSLRLMGKVAFEWPKERIIPKEKRVLVGGAFELIHPGHIFFLKEASKMGRVIVIVARDATILKTKKRPSIIPEKQRLEVVKGIKYVDEVYLGFEDFDLLRTIKRYKPDVILLGPDQDFLHEKLSEIVREKGICVKIVKLESRMKKFRYSSTSRILQKIIEMYNKSIFKNSMK